MRGTKLLLSPYWLALNQMRDYREIRDNEQKGNELYF
jgi:hypothetical protein